MKRFAIVGMVLFLGVAIAPGINAIGVNPTSGIGAGSEFESVKICVYGEEATSWNCSISVEQVDELESLFSDFYADDSGVDGYNQLLSDVGDLIGFDLSCLYGNENNLDSRSTVVGFTTETWFFPTVFLLDFWPYVLRDIIINFFDDFFNYHQGGDPLTGFFMALYWTYLYLRDVFWSPILLMSLLITILSPLKILYEGNIGISTYANGWMSIADMAGKQRWWGPLRARLQGFNGIAILVNFFNHRILYAGTIQDFEILKGGGLGGSC